MKKINLLPFRIERKKENIRRELSVYLLSILFLFVLLIYFSININSTLNGLLTEKANIKKELSRYSKTLNKIKQLKKKTSELKKKIQIVENISSSKKGPVELFDKIAMAVPERKLWLTSLSQKHGTINLKGMARDNDTIALYMTNLEKIKKIHSVDLISISTKNMKKENMSVCNFSLQLKTAVPKHKGKKNKGHNRRKR